MIEKLPVAEDGDGFIAYKCGDSQYYIEVKAGTIMSDHTHREVEEIFLFRGRAEFTLGDSKEIIEGPVKIIIPPNVYHKCVALTDLYGFEIKSALRPSASDSAGEAAGRLYRLQKHSELG